MAAAASKLTILVAREDLSITRASCAPGQQITKPRVHRWHTDAFYVLDGELTFDIACQTMTVSAGGFVAVPPNVRTRSANAGTAAAEWLTIHTPDGGFAEFISGAGGVAWDVAAV